MAQQNIDVGSAANDRQGDSLRSAFQKVNANFTELYTALGLDTAPLNLGAFTFTDSVISTEDSSNIVIDRPTTINGELAVDGDITPKTDLGSSLGTPDKRFQDIYLSGNTIYLGTTRISIDEQGNLLVGGTAIADVGTAAWNNITGKPTFSALATSGNYSDLVNAPTLSAVASSGDYDDLSNKPTIPTVPTAVSQLTNDSNFIVLQDVLDAGFLTAADIAGGTLTIDVNNTGDLKGSVFGDDSTLLVDGVAGKINLQNTVLNNTISTSDENFFINTAATPGDRGFTNITTTDSILDIQGAAALPGGQGGGVFINGGIPFDDPSDYTRYGDIIISGRIVSILAGDGEGGGGIAFGGPVFGTTAMDVKGSVFADDSTLLVDGVNGRLVGPLATENISHPSNDGLGLRLNSTDQSTLLVAKQSFDRTFDDDFSGYTFSMLNSPNRVRVTFDTNSGLYLRGLLARWDNLYERISFGDPIFFEYDYSNIRLSLEPDTYDVVTNVVNVIFVSDNVYDIEIDQDPITVLFDAGAEAGELSQIALLYDYNNTMGFDIENNRYGIAVDHENIDLRAGRDIDLYAVDDFRVRAGSNFDLTLNRTDDQSASEGIYVNLISNNDALPEDSKTWTFRFDGGFEFPDGEVQTTAYPGPQTSLDGDVTGSVFGDDSTLLVDGVAGKIVGPVEVSANGSIVFKNDQDPNTWADGSIETTGYAYQLNFPTNQTSNTAPLIVGWNDYPYIQPYLPTDIGASEGSSGFVRRTIELRGGDATDTRAPGLLLLNGGSNSSAGLYGEVRINNVAGDVKIGNNTGTTTIAGNTIASGQLTVEESYSATPTTKFFEIETGAGNNRLLRTGVNMSAFAQEFGPEIDLTSYRSSPANGDAGPGLVLRASTGASVNDVIATIGTEVTDTTDGNVTSKISFTTKNNGSSVTPLTITASTIDFVNANVQNFAPGNIYANSGQYLYVTGKHAGGTATNVAFTYDTNINNVRQTFYGKTEFGNNGQAPIVDFTDATISGVDDLTVGTSLTVSDKTINTPDTSTGGASSSVATALDVTKTLQVLNSTDSDDDSWTLADGTEGQIMHFVPGSGTGSNQHYIEIANWRRWDSDTSSWIVEQDLTWIPFKMDFDGTTWTGVATAIFTDGAWQTSNPWID